MEIIVRAGSPVAYSADAEFFVYIWFVAAGTGETPVIPV